MLKCPKCKVESATHRAEAVCPTCGRLLNADEVFRLLKKLGLSEELDEKLEKDICYHKVTH